MIWGYFASEWGSNEVVSFNGETKTISVNSGVTSLDIRKDVYSAWVRWVSRDFNARYISAMRFSGMDAIPGGETGGVFFLRNGWKLLYDPSVVAVDGVLYSDNYDTAYYTYYGLPVYPAKASALVVASANQITEQYLNDALISIAGTQYTLQQITDAVWTRAQRELTAATTSSLTEAQNKQLMNALTTSKFIALKG